MTSFDEEYKRFISWQCRLRKMSMREMGGRPTTGMSAGVHSINGGDEQAQLQFLIVKQEPQAATAEIRHIVRKTPDPAEWVKNGLRILAERHYQDDFNFSSNLTALFSLDSQAVESLKEAGQCHLKFKQDSIEFGFDFDVEELDESDAYYQSTYWHNRLFNPTLPGKVRVLSFIPRLASE
ncbi:MAG: hypothetical protein GY806_15455 [Gammaproteobacteria bacterium]|nr:hypothetical protein [Gammaproteobacteria bacterium]